MVTRGHSWSLVVIRGHWTFRPDPFLGFYTEHNRGMFHANRIFAIQLKVSLLKLDFFYSNINVERWPS